MGLWLMGEPNEVDGSLYVFGYGSLIEKQDGLLLTLKIEQEGGQMSSHEERSVKGIKAVKKHLQSQESTETSTEHGPEARSESEPTKDNFQMPPELGEAVGRFASVECKYENHDACFDLRCECRHHGRVPGDVKTFPEPQFEGQTGHPDTEDSDLVNHPIHYTNQVPNIECIDVVQHFNFNKGNAIKYLWRAESKGNEIQDLLKAMWYIEAEILRLKVVEDEASKNW